MAKKIQDFSEDPISGLKNEERPGQADRPSQLASWAGPGQDGQCDSRLVLIFSGIRINSRGEAGIRVNDFFESSGESQVFVQFFEELWLAG